MFLEAYLDDFYYNEVMNNYDYNYLMSIDPNNFKEVYNIFVNNNFNYISDIILKYIEMFELNPSYVEDCINTFKNKLGNDYIHIMGSDMRYFDMIIDSFSDNLDKE